jgi:outer membrane protein assembly factor BamD
MKDAKSAELYYNVGQFKAAAIAYTNVMNNHPDSDKNDLYKLQVIKAYYEYALLSIDEKKEERFQQVIGECIDFTDRFPDSKLLKDIEKYSTQSQSNIKNLKK